MKLARSCPDLGPASASRRPAGRTRPVLAVLAVVLSGVLPAAAPAASLQASHGAVAAEHRLASAAGVEILRRGGNAVDAAVAAALATGVVNPSSSGLGGGGFLVVWDAGRRRAFAIDFRETAPSGAFETMFERGDGTADSGASRTGPLAVGVPGEARGLALALARHGRRGLADVAAPAIRLAREGFAIEAHLARAIDSGRGRLAADPELARVFLHADGSPLVEGETLRRPQLAATLERLVEVGVDDFYEGEIAADIVAALASRMKSPSAMAGAAPPRRPRPVRAEDLAAYRPVEREPLRFNYRGNSVATMGPPSSGGGVLAEALGVLSAWNIGALEPGGPTWAHAMAETMKAVFADRAVFYGDPAFADVPLERLLGPDHLAAIRSKISWKRAAPSSEFAPLIQAGRDAGTTHISVVDADGNAAALTTSVNTSFGAGLSVPGRDIVLNNTMDDFSIQPGKPNAFGLVGSQANAIAPGKRPLSSMTPVIVTWGDEGGDDDGDQVRLVAGASGGPLIITATLATLVGVLDFGMDTEAAVGAPRVHHQWVPELLYVEEGIPEATRRDLSGIGHELRPLTAGVSVQAIAVTGRGQARTLDATSDPRKGGVPAGY